MCAVEAQCQQFRTTAFKGVKYIYEHVVTEKCKIKICLLGGGERVHSQAYPPHPQAAPQGPSSHPVSVGQSKYSPKMALCVQVPLGNTEYGLVPSLQAKINPFLSIEVFPTLEKSVFQQWTLGNDTYIQLCEKLDNSFAKSHG